MLHSSESGEDVRRDVKLSAATRPAAAIFDMDGLLFDTERVSCIAWQQTGKEFGYEIGPDIFLQMVGNPIEVSGEILKRIFGEQLPYWEMRARRNEIGDEIEHSLDNLLKPGVREIFDFLEARDIPKAVATNTPVERTKKRLERFNLLTRVEVIVSSEMVAKGKPAPDVYLETASRLGVRPVDCIVFEDSPQGVEAAYNAGMRCVLIPDLRPPPPELQALAVYSASSLLETLGFLHGVIPEY